jgi:hypothetical protein
VATLPHAKPFDRVSVPSSPISLGIVPPHEGWFDGEQPFPQLSQSQLQHPKTSQSQLGLLYVPDIPHGHAPE